MIKKILRKFSYVKQLEEANAIMHEGLDKATAREYELLGKLETLKRENANIEVCFEGHRKYVEVLEEQIEKVREQRDTIEEEAKQSAEIIGFLTTYPHAMLVDTLTGQGYVHINKDQAKEFEGCKVFAELQPSSTKIMKVYVKGKKKR